MSKGIQKRVLTYTGSESMKSEVARDGSRGRSDNGWPERQRQ